MKLYVVGIGPGELSQITPAAMAAMEESDVIAGYTVYVDLVRGAFCRQGILDHRNEAGGRPLPHGDRKGGRGQNRFRWYAAGTPGVYGMAGLIYELAQQYPPIEICVIPGITAAMSGAAVLGRSAHPRFCGYQLE